MKPRLTVYFSRSYNPYLNLAIEDHIFKNMRPDEQILYLWRNDNTVVIGRFQNPWVECRVKEIEHDGVFLARRQSGGGAVYHDLGNTNFTFFSPKTQYDKERNIKIIIDSLDRFGIDASMSGRNDILVDGKKVSGSAFKLTASKAFHHGTLLVNTDLDNLEYYLTPDREKLESKGIASIRSRVVNLADINPRVNHEELCDAIVSRFVSEYGGTAPAGGSAERRNLAPGPALGNHLAPDPAAGHNGPAGPTGRKDIAASPTVRVLTEEDAMREPSVRTAYEEYADWDWRIGKTPRFSVRYTTRFPWGSVDVLLSTRHGSIEEATVYSDSLDEGPLSVIRTTLQGSRCTGNREEWVRRACSFGGGERWKDRFEDFFSWFSEKM